MIRKTGWRVVRAVALLMCVLRGGVAQDTAASTVYHLHGTVVNGQTGQPLARALVASLDRRLATMTNSDGRFVIDIHMASDQPNRGRNDMLLGIVAQRPGFVPQNRPTTLTLDDALSSTDVTLKLMPTAAITGTVSTPSSDAPRDVRLLLLRRQIQDGAPVWLPAGMRSTNSQGEFRFGNLVPGEYTVMTQEYLDGDRIPREPTRVTQRYPPVYSGDAADLRSAGKMLLHYGETSRTDIHLHLATYYPVTIPVSAQGNGVPMLQAQVADTFGGYQISYNQQDRAVEGVLPDGSYTLAISSFGQPQSFARVPIHVAGAPVHAGPVALAPAGIIAVRVRAEFTGQTKMRPGVQVSLRPEDAFGSFAAGGSRPGHEDEFSLENVQPGEYFVTVHTSYGYVAAASSGETDLLEHRLSVSASGTAAPIEVVLRDDGGRLDGHVVASDGSLPPFSVVVLVPGEGTGSMVQGYAGPDGRFTVQNIAPGSYRLLAVNGSPGNLPFRDPDAMQPYTANAPKITVEAGESLSMDAPLIDATGDGQ